MKQVSKDTGMANSAKTGGSGRTGNVQTFIEGGALDISDWMGLAHHPYRGYISKGVQATYLDPLEKRGHKVAISCRKFEIACSSSRQYFGLLSNRERNAAVNALPKDKVMTFSVKIGKKWVKLCKVFNSVNFGGFVACLVMTPEEAKDFDPRWHSPEDSVKDDTGISSSSNGSTVKQVKQVRKIAA